MQNYSFIDMHIHTMYSDEELCDESPKHILEKVQKYAEKFNKENGTNMNCLVGFADHNSVLASIKAKTLLKSGEYPNVEYVTACEFTTDLSELMPYTNNKKVFYRAHILAYNFDESNPELVAYSRVTHLHYTPTDNVGQQICSARREVCERYNVNFPFSVLLSLTKLESKANFGLEFVRVIKKYFERNKIKYNYEDLKNIADKNILTTNPAYLELATSKCKLKLSEVFNLVKNAGGDVVLAHPALLVVDRQSVVGHGTGSKNIILGMVRENTNKVLQLFIESYKKLTGYKLDGIEQFHHTSYAFNIYNEIEEICKNNNIYVTGGSDYHGENFPTHATIGDGMSRDIQLAYKEENEKRNIKNLYVRLSGLSSVIHYKSNKSGYSPTLFIDDENKIISADELLKVVETAKGKKTIKKKEIKIKKKDNPDEDLKHYISKLEKVVDLLHRVLNLENDYTGALQIMQTAEDSSLELFGNVKLIQKYNSHGFDLFSDSVRKHLVTTQKNLHKYYSAILLKYPQIMLDLEDSNYTLYHDRETYIDKMANMKYRVKDEKNFSK